MVLRMTDSGPAAVQATSTAPLLPMVAGDAGAGKRTRAELRRQSSREDPPPPQHKKVRTRRTARQKGSSTGLEVGCNLQPTFQLWRSAAAYRVDYHAHTYGGMAEDQLHLRSGSIF